MADALGDIELPGIPKCQNCLAWSEEGELAVAIGDQIFVLASSMFQYTCVIVNTLQNPSQESDQISRPQRTRGSWHRTQFSVGSFLRMEWPEVKLDGMNSTRDAFIGREQTAAEVVAIAWSPSGAIQRSCCSLAVLTTNGILSIWALDSHQNASAKWKRNSVINSAMNLSKQGVLAMSWAPILDSHRIRPENGALHMSRRPLTWKYHLAVLFGDNSMCIFKINPFPGGSPTKHRVLTETATVIISGTIAMENEMFRLGHTPRVSSYAPDLGTAFYGIRWSQWQYDPENGQAEAKILVRAKDNENWFRIRSNKTANLHIEKEEPFATNPTGLRCGSLDDEGWSGACVGVEILGTGSDTLEHHRACVVTQGLDLKFYELDDANYSGAKRPEWIAWPNQSVFDRQVQKLKSEFSPKNKTVEEVDVRVWGLATFGGVIALCITLHPNTLLHYVTSAITKTHILFSRYHLELLNIAQPLENTVGIRFPETISQSFEKTDFEAHSQGVLYAGLVTRTNELQSTKVNFQVMFTVFVASLLQQNPAKSFRDHVESVLYRYRSDGDTNPIITMISESISQECRFEEISKTAVLECVNQFIMERSSVEVSENQKIRYLEYCSLIDCGRPLFWSYSLGASCIEGHHQERCSLTALAIMNPYVVKRCGGCNRPYLDENRLDLYYGEAAKSGMISTAQYEATPTEGEDAVEWMLQAVTCIYCNGKFSRMT